MRLREVLIHLAFPSCGYLLDKEWGIILPSVSNSNGKSTTKCSLSTSAMILDIRVLITVYRYYLAILTVSVLNANGVPTLAAYGFCLGTPRHDRVQHRYAMQASCRRKFAGTYSLFLYLFTHVQNMRNIYACFSSEASSSSTLEVGTRPGFAY
jgi:hypothetical protein